MNKKYFGLSFSAIILISIVVISATMHARHFNKDLMGMHVWRQSMTQSNIINFYEEDMNIFNPRRNDRGSGDGIFRYEFPLPQWLVACTYKIFGNHLIISRLWMFITGLFSVFGMYKLLKGVFKDEIPALIGAWAFNFSPSFYYFTINPMPDNLALCLGIWGLALFFSWIRQGRKSALIFSGIMLGLSALCKLPFVLYFAVPVGYFLFIKPQAASHKLQAAGYKPIIPNPQSHYSLFIIRYSILRILSYAIYAIPALAWYIYVVPQWQGNGIVQGILHNQAGISGLWSNFSHHLFITLPELLLNYGSVLFFLAAFWFIFKQKAYKKRLFLPLALLGILLICYFLFELNMIGKSHDYYLFPFLPLLFTLVSYGAHQLYQSDKRLVREIVLALLLVLPFAAFLRIDQRWNPEKPGFNKDLLVYKNELREAVPKNALCVIGNDFSHYINFYYLDKKGWCFDSDWLDDKQLEKMINDGAQYLYSDSRKIDQSLKIRPFLGDLIMEKGTVRVFRLNKFSNP